MEESSLLNLQPIGVGYFGDIYDQFRGKAKEAFEFLVAKQSGDLLGVFHDNEIGDIDLVWGSITGNKGLDHTIAKEILSLKTKIGLSRLSTITTQKQKSI